MKRAVARKVLISQVLEAKLDQVEAGNQFLIDNKHVSRVNLYGRIIDMYANGDATYLRATLEDKSGKIIVKAFGQETEFFQELKAGDMVIVIGKIRQDGDEKFIIAEIVKKPEDPNYAQTREKDLETTKKDTTSL